MTALNLFARSLIPGPISCRDSFWGQKKKKRVDAFFTIYRDRNIMLQRSLSIISHAQCCFTGCIHAYSHLWGVKIKRSFIVDAPFILFLISRRKRSRIPSFQKSGNSFLAVIKKSLFFILQYFPSTIGSISFKGRNFIQSFVTDGSASAASETLGDRIVTSAAYAINFLRPRRYSIPRPPPPFHHIPEWATFSQLGAWRPL